jgi:hypothetical protein
VAEASQCREGARAPSVHASGYGVRSLFHKHVDPVVRGAHDYDHVALRVKRARFSRSNDYLSELFRESRN